MLRLDVLEQVGRIEGIRERSYMPPDGSRRNLHVGDYHITSENRALIAYTVARSAGISLSVVFVTGPSPPSASGQRYISHPCICPSKNHLQQAKIRNPLLQPPLVQSRQCKHPRIALCHQLWKPSSQLLVVLESLPYAARVHVQEER